MHCKTQYIIEILNYKADCRDQMTTTRPRVKTATITLRVDPKIKAAAEAAAELEHRSITSLIEVLILNHCRSRGLCAGQKIEEQLQ